MTSRGQINSNFYQIANVDANGTVTEVNSTYIKGMDANVANVHISGGAGGQVLTTDGFGNLAWANGGNGGNGGGTPGGPYNSVQYNNSGVFDGSTSFTFDSANGKVLANYFVGDGSLLTSLTGANVTGTVANATYATTAGSATTAATVTANSQPNITSIGALTSLSVTGNITSGNATLGNLVTANYFTGNGSLLTNVDAVHANVADSANSVAVANVVGIGNIATVNLDGNVSNILHGNGYWGPESESLNANYANFAGNVTISAQPNITSVGNLVNLQFNNTVTPITANVGQMFWDTSEHTISLGMENGVTQQIGLENFIYVKASSAITDGQVVMFTGANGDNITAAPANAASGGFKAEYILGIATQDIATNGFGYITVFGQVHGLNTLAYTVGDILWYDPTSTTGGLTATQPTDPAYQIRMGVVTKRAGGDGHIAVQINVIGTLNLLTDVTITTPTTGQALVYNGTNVWVNGNAAYSNTAGTVTANAQPNITSVGTLSSLNVTGNITSGNATLGNLVTSNYFAGTLTTGAQPNITSVGTLTNLSVTGNISSGNANLGNLVTANYFTGNGSLLTSLTGANVTGTVANATYSVSAGSATTAATVTANAQPNITSVGTLTSLNITGNITSGNAVLGNLVTSNYFSGNGSLLTGVTVSAPGSNTQVLINDGGVIGANTNLSFDKTSNVFIIGDPTTGGTGGILKTSSIRTYDIRNQNNYIVLNQSDPTSGVYANVSIPGDVSTGNITAPYFIGNGSLLTGIVASGGAAITNGNSNVTVTANSNVTVSITGVANTAVFYASGLTLGTGNITSGNAVLGNLVTANFFTGNGSLLTSLTGGNVTGVVANATFATTAGSATTAATVTANAQPNITSIGSLTSLTVTGISNFGPNGNVIITGGTTGQVLTTNGSGNLSWTTPSSGGSTGFEQTFLLMGA